MTLTADDIAEIVNLSHAYNQAVDRHDPKSWTDTFTEDGELSSPFGNPQGTDALHEWISGVTASLSGTRHCSVNEVVAGNGNTATMSSYYFVVGTTDAPPTIGATGAYDDELKRGADGWRFRRRVHTVDASFGGEALTG
jgi:ketosteroid isomerase-like protein